MNRQISLIVIGFIAVFCFRCTQSEDFEIIGKWQSLNCPSVIEFTNVNSVDLYREEGIPLWSITSSNGKLTYIITNLDRNWYQLRVMDGEELFLKSKIEVVNRDRIRIYYYKHHDILDTADEYHRTEDFQSFSQIMENIMEGPDE